MIELELSELVRSRQITWDEALRRYEESTGKPTTKAALRGKADRARAKGLVSGVSGKEYTTQVGNIIEAQKIVEYNAEIFGDDEKLIAYLGYDPTKWEFVSITTSTWQQHTREQTTKNLYAVKFKIKPRYKDISPQDAFSIAKEVFAQPLEIPVRLPQASVDGLNDNLLMEVPPIELHLGKLAWRGDTGEDYDSRIARNIFEDIISEVVSEQKIRKCGKLLLMVGSDFFNSDTTENTTTKGTLQQNDSRYKKMFTTGLEMYTSAITELSKHFNDMSVRLVQGNHDEMSSFYLYMALKQYFKDIDFSDDCKSLQSFPFGNIVVFFHHGNGNMKRLIQSIPAEFPVEWGNAKYRELHIGHGHRELTIDDAGGLITRMIGSPCGTENWHYQNRFVGATKKHQVFVWDKEKGLLNCRYIPFSSDYYV